MEEIINGLLDLELIGKIALLVLLTVQGLKVFKFVDGESAPKAAILSAFVFGVGLAAGELYAPIAPFVALFVTMYIGVMVAGLGYEYIAKPLLEKFGIDVSAASLK